MSAHLPLLAGLAGLGVGWWARGRTRRSGGGAPVGGGVAEGGGPPSAPGAVVGTPSDSHLAALGTMAAGLAHEIRNPLAGIKGAAQYLQVGRVGADADMVGVIIDEVDRLDAVVGRFLEYARPAPPAREPVELARVVRRVVQVVEAAGLPPGVELGFDVPDGVGDGLLGDADRLVQVVLNLVQNAIRAMPRGGSVSIDAARGSDSVTLTVRDTGDGIAPGELEQIFAPFWTSRPDGTGLGLAVSRRIVESHGGTLSAASVVGHGATFTVRLPLAPS